MTTTTIHYQVTDFESLCDTETTEGTTIERRVNCPKCLHLLARINDDTCHCGHPDCGAC